MEKCTLENRIHIASCADRNYLFPMAAMLKSVSLHHHEKSVTASLLVSGFSREERQLVEALAPQIDIAWYEIDDYADALPTSLQNVASKVAYARLLLPELLPRHISRVLYLDADVIVCSSLHELWELSLPDDCSLAAVYDAYIPWAASPEGTSWQMLGLAPDMPYFNSGVMLVNLHDWREQEISRTAIDLAKATTLPYDDQCALNAVVGGKWKAISPAWNLQSAYLHGWHFGWINYGRACFQAALDKPVIIHYTSGGKPWLMSEHPLSDAFYRVVDSTQFAGWRPNQGSEPWKSYS